MSEKQQIIYGVKSGETYRYIGKSQKSEDQDLKKSDARRQYTRKDIRRVFVENQGNVVLLKTVEDDWYGEKLQEVLNKYKEKHPLLNAQWMLEGKRGFWEGKPRDAHTIKRLSESKFKQVCQYDSKGVLIAIWDSSKEVAEILYKDYHVVNGGGVSRFYDVIRAKSLRSRFAFDSYWFYMENLLKDFVDVPVKLDIETILRAEHQKRCDSRKNRICNEIKRYTVCQYDQDNNLIRTFENTYHTAYEFRVSVENIQRLCRGSIKNNNYILKYGEKTLQPIIINYPPYKIKPLTRPKKIWIPKAKPYVHTRTRTTVELLDECQEVLMTFGDFWEAGEYFNMDAQLIRRICLGLRTSKVRGKYVCYPNLRFGKKVQTIIV
jgi:hypothetical protein